MFFIILLKKMFYWYIVTGRGFVGVLVYCYSRNGCFFKYVEKKSYLCSRNNN